MSETEKITIDGITVNKETLTERLKNSKIRLKETSPGVYVTLTQMLG